MSGPTMGELNIRVTANKAIADVRAFGEASARTGQQVSTLERGVAVLGGAFAAYKLADYARQAIGLADAYKNMTSRLSLVTTGTENLARVQGALFASAQNARTSFEATTELYARMARNAGQLGASQTDLLHVTDNINKAMVVSGVSAESSRAALIQLGQAFASGTLRGDELNSVLEQAPRLAQAIAGGLGVTIGQLRAMGAAGELTGQKVFEALNKDVAIGKEFEKIPITVAGAMTQLKNATLQYVGSIDSASGVTGTLAAAISGLSKNIDSAVQVATLLGTVMVARFVGGMVDANRETIALARSVVHGNSVMLSSVEAQRGAAQSAVERAQVQVSSASRAVAALKAEEAEIVRLMALEKERAVQAAAEAARAAAYVLKPINTGARGPAADYYGRKEQDAQNAAASLKRAAALETEAGALANVTALDERRIQVAAQGTAVEAARGAAVNVETAAIARQGEVMAATSLSARAYAGAMAGIGTAVSALGGPLGLAIIGFTAINMAIDAYGDHLMKAAEQTDKQRAATDAALDSAHKRAAAEKKLTDELTEQQRKFQALSEERTQGIGKQAALNAVFGQSALTLQVVGIGYDAMIQKSKDAKEHKGKELAALNALTDGMANQLIVAAKLADAEEARGRASKLANANNQVDIATQIAASQQKQADAAKATETALAGVVRQYERIRAIFAGHEAEDAAAAAEKAAQQKYADDIKAIWQESAGRIAADFIKSMSRGFEEVYSLAVKLMKRMEDANKASGLGYTALKYGAAAIGGGLAGYSAGSAVGANGGSAAQAALGGAASGAMAGAAFGPWGALAGGIAGAAAGLFGFGKAAAEAAKQMAEAQKSIRLNITAAELDTKGDTVGAGTARIHAEIESMRKAVEDAFSGGGAGSAQVRARNVELARLNTLEADRIRALNAAHDLSVQQANEDVQVQILRNNGRTEEADAMARAIDQERRFTELRGQGVGEDTIARLRESEAFRANADAAAVEAAKAIEDAAKAAQVAADAAQKAFEQARAVEDINVELLNAQGRTGEAADLEFQLSQQRRLDDAKKTFGEGEFVSKLLELQQLQRDQRAAQQLIDSTTGPSGSGGRSATAAAAAVAGGISDRSALALLDLTRAQNTTLEKIEANTRGGGGAGGGGTTIHVHIEKRSLEDILDEIRHEIAPYVNEDLGTTKQQTSLRSGSVKR